MALVFWHFGRVASSPIPECHVLVLGVVSGTCHLNACLWFLSAFIFGNKSVVKTAKQCLVCGVKISSPEIVCFGRGIAAMRSHCMQMISGNDLALSSEQHYLAWITFCVARAASPPPSNPLVLAYQIPSLSLASGTIYFSLRTLLVQPSPTSSSSDRCENNSIAFALLLTPQDFPNQPPIDFFCLFLLWYLIAVVPNLTQFVVASTWLLKVKFVAVSSQFTGFSLRVKLCQARIWTRAAPLKSLRSLVGSRKENVACTIVWFLNF